MKKTALKTCIAGMIITALAITAPYSFASSKATLVSNDYKLNFANDSATSFVDIEPMYDLPEDFVFEFKYDKKLPWLTIDFYRGTEVYIDKECTIEASAIFTDSEDGKSLILYPGLYGSYDLLDEDRVPDTTDYDAIEGRTWGGLQTYYLKMEYDLINGTFEKLDKPLRMMFTLESKVDAPTPRFDLQSNGEMRVVWAPVKDAVKYRIYSGALIHMNFLEEVTDTEFSFTENIGEYIVKENCMNGKSSHIYDLGVVAVDKYGNYSRIAKILDNEPHHGKLPYTLASPRHRYYSKYDVDSIMDLPKEVEVEMDGHDENYEPITRLYKVLWDFDQSEKDKFGNEQYTGRVIGTTLELYYTAYDPLTAQEIKAFKESRDEAIVKAVRTDDAEKVAIESAPSIEELKEIEKKDHSTSSQKNIRTHIESSTSKKVEKVSLDEAILMGWLNFEERIPLAAYPEAKDGNYLVDLLLALRYQNPLVQGIAGIDFDYVNGDLLVSYEMTREEGKERQEAVLNKVDEIIDEIIEPADSNYEKIKKINDWIVANAEYHQAPLNDYLDGVDQKLIDKKYADSFQPSGILFKGRGVCQSYAGVFKLLADQAGVETIMVSGDSSGVPHAWNKIKINDSWVNIDTTFNDNGIIPYPVFGASDEYTGYILDNTHLLDSELKEHESLTNQYDFYEILDLLAETSSELTTILDRVSEGKETILVKVNPLMSYADIKKAIEASKLATDSSVEDVESDKNFLYIFY